MHINYGSSRPGVALVDGITVCIHLQGAIEVRAFFYRAFAVVVDATAPEYGFALIVGALQFKPRIVGVDRTAGEEVADFFRADYHIHAYRISSADAWLGSIQWRGNRQGFRFVGRSDFCLRFLAHCKSRR